MLKDRLTITKMISVAIITTFIHACGDTPIQKSANLEWIKSRSNSQRYAFLTRDDLNDTFLLGASVTKVSNFPSNALNMVIRPLKVSLSIDTNLSKLYVKEKSSHETLFAFDLNTYQGYWEIDFASAGNDLKLKHLISQVGGMYTASDKTAYWLSQGPPRIQSIDQDQDTMVVDLLHTIKLVRLASSMAGTYISDILTPQAGTVNVRLWLKRQKSLPHLLEHRTVAEARKQNIGYFGSNFVSTEEEENSEPIQRFDINESITFYLKDFPSDYAVTAQKAILSWNQAFDRKIIKVAPAPSHIDVGDPRYHVIKWFDDTDNNLGWAGVAKMLVDPDSGLVMSGSVYIQGSTLLNLYKKIVNFSMLTYNHQITSGSFGRVNFDSDRPETPIIPFLTDVRKSFSEYMKGYYEETIAHEVGHVLGLRHNFAASAYLDENLRSASVMDYLPRSERSAYHGPGFYDISAIRWGYYGELPDKQLPFCTDEDEPKYWNCNKGDFGSPITYTIKGIKDSLAWLTSSPVEVTDDVQIISIVGLAESAIKLWQLREQMPQTQKSALENTLPQTYQMLFSAKPSADLSNEEKMIVEKNIKRMESLISQKIAELKKLR